MQKQIGKTSLAEKSFSRATQLLEGLVEQHPDRPRLTHNLAVCLNNLSFVQRSIDIDQAEHSCRRAIVIQEELISSYPQVLDYRSDLALCYNNLGAIQSHRSAQGEACKSYFQAIELQKQLRRQAPPVVRYRSDLAVSLNNLGQAYHLASDLERAESAFQRSQELFEQLTSDFPDELMYRSSLGGVLNNQAMTAEDAECYDKAIAIYTEAIRYQRFAFEKMPSSVHYRSFLSKHYFNYGRALRAADKPIEAAHAALERRQLWPEHGEHLYQIALELTQAIDQMAEGKLKNGTADATGAERQKIRKQFRREAIATLRLALDAGYRPKQKLGSTGLFAILRDDPDFVLLTQSSENF